MASQSALNIGQDMAGLESCRTDFAILQQKMNNSHCFPIIILEALMIIFDLIVSLNSQYKDLNPFRK